jgi:hypothetical protein
MNRSLTMLGLLLTMSALYGQFAVGPISLVFSMRKGEHYPNNSTKYPANQTLRLTGSGHWSAITSGPLSYQCDGPCITITPKSGVGSQTLTVSFLGNGAESLPEGSITGLISVGSQVVPLTLNVLPPRAFDENVYTPGYPVGCYNSSPYYSHQDTCQVPNELPGATSIDVPAPGVSKRDSLFGGDFTRLTPAGYNIQYSTISAFSATAKYVLTSSDNGSVHVFDRLSRTVAFANVQGINITFAAWDPYDDDRLWYMDGSTIRYRRLSRDETVVAANYTSGSGSRPAFTSITMGGTADITDDGWWVFTSGQTLCAVDLTDLSQAIQENKTKCANVTPLGLTFLDFAQVTQIDSESRKRYVVLMSIPQNHLFSIQASGLVHEIPIPTGPNDVWPASHLAVGQDSEGRQLLLFNYHDIYGSRSYLATAFLNKGPRMTEPAEVNGGLRLLYQNDPQNWSTDTHFGCTWRGLCVTGNYGNSDGILITNIASIKIGGRCEIVTRTPHGFAGSMTVLIGGALDVEGVNGLSSIEVTGAFSFVLSGRICSGTYRAGSGNVIRNVVTEANSPNRGELVVVRPGHEVRRIGVHRSKPFKNGYNLLSYFASPRASLNRSGQYIAFASNFGIPESPSVWVVDTSAPAGLRIWPQSTSVGQNSVILAYNVPEQQSSALVVISKSPDLASGIVARVYDGQTAVSRSLNITSLQPGTTYYYRISTGQFSYTGTFKTTVSVNRLRP